MAALSAALLAAALAAASPESEPSTAELGAAASVSLAAVGDIRLDGPIATAAAAHGPAAPTADVAAELVADIVFGNLETPITTRGVKTPKTWNFRAHPRSLKIIRKSGFTVLNLANNHVWDYGEEGFLDTLRHLRRGRWILIGAGRDREDAEAVKVITKGGLRIGFVGLTSTYPKEGWAKERKPGVAYSAYERVPRIVSRAKARCDVLVVSFHGGAELAEQPNEIQKAVAHAAVDAGADLFLGHHPHVLQPLEIYRDKPVLYSLGNFLFVSPSTSTQHTAIARVQLSSRGVSGIEFVPLEINGGRLKSAGPEAVGRVAEALDRWGALSGRPGYSVRNSLNAPRQER